MLQKACWLGWRDGVLFVCHVIGRVPCPLLPCHAAAAGQTSLAARQLRTSCQSNLASCYLQLQRWQVSHMCGDGSLGELTVAVGMARRPACCVPGVMVQRH